MMYRKFSIIFCAIFAFIQGTAFCSQEYTIISVNQNKNYPSRNLKISNSKKNIVFKINDNEDSTGKIILDEKNIKILRGLDTEKENSLTVQNSKNATYNIQITKEKNLEVQDWLKSR